MIIQSRLPTEEYRDNFDRIFRKEAVVLTPDQANEIGEAHTRALAVDRNVIVQSEVSR